MSFVHWIIAECKKNGINKLFFLAREGEFFQRIYYCLNEHTDIHTQLLMISRMSTFLPSMGQFMRHDWNRFLGQYGNQSVRNLIMSLGLPEGELERLFETKGLVLDKSIMNQLDLFYEAVESSEIHEYLMEKSSLAREDTVCYLHTMGFDRSDDIVAVVDIGWRGTIQDNLCYLFPDKIIFGYYFGLIPFLNEQPANAIKRGFVNRFPFSGMLLKSHTQLEMLCTSPRGSTLFYVKDNTGECHPVFENNEQDVNSWNRYTRFFQDGVIAGAHEDYQQGTAAILWLTIFPNKGMSRAFFSFQYSERFGLGKNVDQTKVAFSAKMFLRGGSGRKGLRELQEYLNGTMWPQAFLRIHGLSWLIPFYNIILIFKTRGQ